MKRIVALLAVSALAALAAQAAAAAPAKGTGSPIPGPFKVCMDISFPPMEYYATQGSSVPVGFDVDVARSVAGRWGVRTKFIPTDFTGLLPALQAGRCDVVWSAIFVTPDRTKEFPAVGYMRTHRVLLVVAGNPAEIKKPADLSGKTAATEAGTKYVDTLKALDKRLRAQGKEGVKVQTYPKATDATAQLLTGRADAVLTQDTEAAFRITKQKGKFEIAFLYPQSDVFGVYYRKDSPEIGRELKDALKALKGNGTLGNIAKKHGLPEAVLNV